MATLAVLRARCRLILASATDWPDAALNAWIGDAIRFYSAEFPRQLRHDKTLVTGTRAYDLPAGCLAVTAVEYPSGEDPAVHLRQVDEWSAEFLAGGEVYALRGIADTVAVTADTATMALVFAEDVTTGEHALVSYLGQHWVPVGDTEYTSVPEAHSEALIAFVDFRAHWELESDEACTLTTVSIILSQLGQEARLAWRRYKEVVDRLQEMTPALERGRVVWGGIGL
jgi:hypothetical protein